MDVIVTLVSPTEVFGRCWSSLLWRSWVHPWDYRHVMRRACTLLWKSEAIINSWFITQASDKQNDVEVHTLNHLLLLMTKQSSSLPALFDKQHLYHGRSWKDPIYIYIYILDVLDKKKITNASRMPKMVQSILQLHRWRHCVDCR